MCRALDIEPKLFADFVNDTAECAAAATKGRHVKIRSYNITTSNALRTAIDAVRHATK